MQTLFLSSSLLLSSVLNFSFIQSEELYSSDKYRKGLNLVSLKYCVFRVHKGNTLLSFSIFLLHINGFWFKLFTNNFLKKRLYGERMTLWALNFWPSTLARVISQKSLSLIFIWAWQRYFRNWSVLEFLKC